LEQQSRAFTQAWPSSWHEGPHTSFSHTSPVQQPSWHGWPSVPQGAHTWLAQMPLQQSLNVVQAAPPSWQLAPPPEPPVVVVPPVPLLLAPVPVDVLQTPFVQEVLVLPHATGSTIARRGNDRSVQTG
jgi:hypothetical protein